MQQGGSESSSSNAAPGTQRGSREPCYGLFPSSREETDPAAGSSEQPAGCLRAVGRFCWCREVAPRALPCEQPAGFGELPSSSVLCEKHLE